MHTLIAASILAICAALAAPDTVTLTNGEVRDGEIVVNDPTTGIVIRVKGKDGWKNEKIPANRIRSVTTANATDTRGESTDSKPRQDAPQAPAPKRGDVVDSWDELKAILKTKMPPTSTRPELIVVPLSGAIGAADSTELFDAITVEHVEMWLSLCKERKPAAILLSIDSPGGYVPEMERIIDLLLDAQANGKLRIVAWPKEAASAAAFICLACKELLARETTSIGGTVYWHTNEKGERVEERIGTGAVDQKMFSYDDARMRKIAQFTGRTRMIMDAMRWQERELWWKDGAGFADSKPSDPPRRNEKARDPADDLRVVELQTKLAQARSALDTAESALKVAGGEYYDTGSGSGKKGAGKGQSAGAGGSPGGGVGGSPPGDDAQTPPATGLLRRMRLTRDRDAAKVAYEQCEKALADAKQASNAADPADASGRSGRRGRSNPSSSGANGASAPTSQPANPGTSSATNSMDAGWLCLDDRTRVLCLTGRELAQTQLSPGIAPDVDAAKALLQLPPETTILDLSDVVDQSRDELKKLADKVHEIRAANSKAMEPFVNKLKSLRRKIVIASNDVDVSVDNWSRSKNGMEGYVKLDKAKLQQASTACRGAVPAYPKDGLPVPQNCQTRIKDSLANIRALLDSVVSNITSNYPGKAGADLDQALELLDKLLDSDCL